MILKNDKGYSYNRPFYAVDPNAHINAGMIAFLVQSGQNIYATTSDLATPSGGVPIGTFWKDHNTTYTQATVESKTFNSLGIVYLTHGSLISSAKTKVASAAGVVYTDGADYNLSVANGTLTRIVGGLIPALATVIVTYEYSLTAAQMAYFQGVNYNQQPDDTLGSGQIAVVEGWAHIYTDQFDVAQTYTLMQPLYPDAESKWTNVVGTTICGRVIEVPSVSRPMLGIKQEIQE